MWWLVGGGVVNNRVVVRVVQFGDIGCCFVDGEFLHLLQGCHGVLCSHGGLTGTQGQPG